MASFVAFVTAIYSASTVDNTTVGCFFADQEMEPPAILKKKLLMDRCESASCAQLESVQPTRLMDSLPLHLSVNPRSAVPFK